LEREESRWGGHACDISAKYESPLQQLLFNAHLSYRDLAMPYTKFNTVSAWISLAVYLLRGDLLFKTEISFWSGYARKIEARRHLRGKCLLASSTAGEARGPELNVRYFFAFGPNRFFPFSGVSDWFRGAGTEALARN